MDRRVLRRVTGLAGVLLIAVLLAGCATTDCDPAQGGYLRGIGCAASGAYDRREAEKKETLSREQERQASLREQYQRTQEEQVKVRTQRLEAERKYATLRKEVEALRTRLEQEKTGNKHLEREVDNLRAQVGMLENDSVTPAADKERRLSELQMRKDALEKQVGAALKR